MLALVFISCFFFIFIFSWIFTFREMQKWEILAKKEMPVDHQAAMTAALAAAYGPYPPN